VARIGLDLCSFVSFRYFTDLVLSMNHWGLPLDRLLAYQSYLCPYFLTQDLESWVYAGCKGQYGKSISWYHVHTLSTGGLLWVGDIVLSKRPCRLLAIGTMWFLWITDTPVSALICLLVYAVYGFNFTGLVSLNGYA